MGAYFPGPEGFVWSHGTYTVFHVPGSTRTFATGINNNGQIVGFYVAADGTFHGFVRSGGVYTTLDVPGSAYTVAYGINNLGEIVGVYRDASGTGHGFLATPAN